jgi:hypothetical protein
VLFPELRATRRRFDVKIYHDQAHCFCSASGLPRPNGMAAPPTWPAAALQAFEDIDASCRTSDQAQGVDAPVSSQVRTGAGPMKSASLVLSFSWQWRLQSLPRSHSVRRHGVVNRKRRQPPLARHLTGCHAVARRP